MEKIRYMFLIGFIFLYSCKKKVVEPAGGSAINLENGILVLNEGLFQQNNASVSFVDFKSLSVKNNFFEQNSGRPLGDTGNDMQTYDGKIFIVMTGSSTIEVVNAETGASIKQIKMIQNGVPKQPRYIAFNGQKAFISCYDGYVDVLDLNSLAILKRIPVGPNPEQLAIANGKLYVSNSGGLNFPNVDSTLSVISLTAEIELSKVTVGKNPGPMAIDSQGDLYVVSRGDFSSIPSRLHRVSTVTDSKIESYLFDADRICLAGNDLLVSYSVGMDTKLLKFNTISESITDSDFGNFEGIQTFYGMQFSEKSNKLYCFDSQGYVNTGFVNEYDLNGNFIRKFNVGLIPNHILLYD